MTIVRIEKLRKEIKSVFLLIFCWFLISTNFPSFRLVINLKIFISIKRKAFDVYWLWFHNRRMETRWKYLVCECPYGTITFFPRGIFPPTDSALIKLMKLKSYECRVNLIPLKHSQRTISKCVWWKNEMSTGWPAFVVTVNRISSWLNSCHARISRIPALSKISS